MTVTAGDDLLLPASSRELLAEIAAAPHAPLSAALVAPSQHGKSSLLRRITESYRHAGVPVSPVPPDAPGDGVLLVDDAHHLGEAELHAIREFALRPGARVVLACRPWPRPRALEAVLTVLGRIRAPLPLRPFEARRTAEFLTTRLDPPPGPGLVREWHAATGGVPGLLAGLVAGGSVATNPCTEPPAPVLATIRGEFDSLGLDAERLLLAVDTGVRWPLATLAGVLEDGHDPVPAVESARAAGLLDATGRLLPLVRSAIRAVIPTDRRVEVYHRMVAVWLRQRGPVRPLAHALVENGMTGPDVGAVLHAAARETAREDPAAAARFCAASAAAGREFRHLAIDWAMACTHAGDVNTALSLADRVISGEAGPDQRARAAGAQVAAAAWAHRGQLERSAELYRWSGSPAATPLAACGLLAVGRPGDAESLHAGGHDDLPPTSREGAFALLADGIKESVSGSASTALATLTRSATLLEPAGTDTLLPDSPAAIAALVGLHGGELAVAESLLERALAVGMGGPSLAVRHRLLLAWIAMARGEFSSAREQLATATSGAATLGLRDWLFAVGLEVGLARRGSDPVGLRRVWLQASEAVLRHPVDLFSLLPLGEFAAAAARLDDSARLLPHLSAAAALLGKLGDPPLWSTPLRWSCLHGAVIAERADEVSEQLAALRANAGHCGYCAAVHTAAARWSELLAGTVDATAVESAAEGLHEQGLWWDAAQLAGQAAVRTSNRGDMVTLLNRARSLRGTPATEQQRPTGGDSGSEGDEPASLLSERERQVAALALDGLTYRQIGDQLYISAKTVEHHMARMRRRLGCATRAELLDTLSRSGM